jgi:hypothetical protein
MMIAHCSIPSDNPQKAAQVLAEIMQGEATRFPPGGPGAWTAWSGDSSISIEIVERGSTIRLTDETGWAPDRGAQQRRYSECHAAICVNRPESEIIAIAQKAGWTARHCERGGGYFNLAEVWVDDAFMLEFLDPAQTALFKERVSARKWKAKLAEMGVA